MKRILRTQQYLIDYTLSSLGRRRGKNFGLLLVYTLIVFFLASVMLFAQSLKREAEIILRNAPEIVLQRLIAGRHGLIPGTYLQKLDPLPGVAEKRGRLWGYYYDPAIKANYTLMVPGADPPACGKIRVGATLARVRGLQPGFFLNLRSADGGIFSLQVAEVLAAQSELVSADLILLCEADFRSFFHIPDGMYTDLILRVRNPSEIVNVARKLTVLLPDTRPILRDEILRTYDAIFNWRQGMVLVLMTGSVLAFVIFAWDKASGLSAAERREIGILKAVGWETADILRMKFWEGAIVSLTSFFLGYLLAYVHIFYTSAMLFAPVLKGWAVLYPHFRPIPQVDGFQVATLFFFTVFPYTVATIIPSWRAAITDPDMVMR